MAARVRKKIRTIGAWKEGRICIATRQCHNKLCCCKSGSGDAEGRDSSPVLKMQ